MRITNNISALNTYRQMGVNQNAATKSMEKLSSGLRINRSADDAAGLAVSEKMRSQIAGLNQAASNAQDGISYIQTAEGALQEVSSILTRMKELNVQKANGTYNTKDKDAIDLELDALGEEITNIKTNTKFNGESAFAAKDIAISHDGGVKLKIEEATLDELDNLDNTTAITAIDDAIDAVNAQRAKYGAAQNRLEHTINNLGATAENLTAAESRIRDTDMAKEMMEFTRANILNQAAQMMMSQANQQPQSVLNLLR